MSDEDVWRPIWLGGGEPLWPSFAPKPPSAPPPAASCHDDDMLAVSLAGGAPEAVSCRRFFALLDDGVSEGSVQLGELDGTVVTASFMQLRAYFSDQVPPHPAAVARTRHPQ